MKLGLIFSNDWELFGDGSGNYFDIQHQPLQDLLHTIENHGAKLTVMAEVAQQWAHQHIAERHEWARDVVEAWESILKQTIKKKHDVQLHLHPQWLNALYDNNEDKWHVDLNQWSLSSLTPETMQKSLKEGKQYLDKILQPIDPRYECIAFRAGAYCIQPSKVAMQCLSSAGIMCDSSVIKGKYDPHFFDYRDAYSNIIPWLACREDIRYKSNGEEGLLEIPIYSHEGIDFPLLRKAVSQELFYKICYGVSISETERRWFSEREKILSQRYPLRNRPYQRSADAHFMKKFKRFWSKFFISRKLFVLDYDTIPSQLFIKFLQNIYDIMQIHKWENSGAFMPVMAIGHTKNIHNCEHMNRILHEINKILRDKVTYITLSDSIRYWLKEGSSRP